MRNKDNNYLRASLFFLASLLCLLGVAASLTGMIRDEKSFYAIAFICLSFGSMLIWFNSRARFRPK